MARKGQRDSKGIIAEDGGASLAILEEARGLIQASDLFRTPVSELSQSTALTVWSVLDLFAKGAITPRVKELRDVLMGWAMDEGVKRGTRRFPRYYLKSDRGNVTVTEVRGKITYDIEALKDFLDDKGIERGALIQKVEKVDEKKLKALVLEGTIKVSELAEFTTEADSYVRMTVKKAREVLDLLGE